MDAGSKWEWKDTALGRRAWQSMLVVVALCGGVGAAVAVSASAYQIGANTTFTAPGEHVFTVPGGVTTLTVTATGGQGGTSNFSDGNGHVCAGGEGAVVGGVLPVSGGQVLYVEVGGAGAPNGSPNGGYGGGGSGVVDNQGIGAQSGGGGGASDLRTVASGSGGSLASRLLVAGGGGGDGDRGGCSDIGGSGGNAGTTAAAGAPGGATGGGGGTSTTGGSAGANGGGCAGSTPTAGTSGTGGTGGGSTGGSGACIETGGGGGGGLYGGGGGGGTSTSGSSGGFVPGAGGGAGSSYIEPAATSASISTSSASQGLGSSSQNGNISFTWNQPDAPSASISTPSGGATYAQNQVVPSSFSCAEGTLGPGLTGCSDNNGSSATITSGEKSTGTIAGSLNTGTVGNNESYTVTATSADGLTTTKTINYTVKSVSPPTATISSPATGGSYYQNESVSTSFTCQEGSGGTGLKSCDDSNSTNSVSGGSGTLNTGTVGTNLSYTVTAVSNDGTSSQKSISYNVGALPTASITQPSSSGAYYAQNSSVLTSFTCSEGNDGPGLASCDDNNGTHTASGGSGTVNTGTIGQNETYTVTATSNDTGTKTATLTYNVADPPTISNPNPANGRVLYQGQSITAAYTCTDGSGGTGIQSCTDNTGGTVATGTVGAASYKITATSKDGLTTSQTINYTVAARPSTPTLATSTPTGMVGSTPYFKHGSSVTTTFSCAEGQDGPGIQTCSDSNGTSSTLHGSLHTATYGRNTYTVTATSQDGATTVNTLVYYVDDPPASPTIATSATGTTFNQGSTVTTTFGCSLAANGGQNEGALTISKCSDSNGSANGKGTLSTSQVGMFSYTVTALQSDGQSTTSTLKYTVQLPCVPSVSFGVTQITGSNTSPSCMLKQTNGTLLTPGPISVNFIPLPALPGGADYVITPGSDSSDGKLSVTTNVSVPITLNGITLFDGPISAGWKLPGGEDGDPATVATLSLPGSGVSIGGMKLTGSISLSFGIGSTETSRYASFALAVGLPAIFKNGPGQDAAGVNGSASVTVDQNGVHFAGLKVEATNVYIGTLEVNEVCFAYDAGTGGTTGGCPAPAQPGSPFPGLTCTAGGGASWSGSADITLPIPGESTELSLYGAFSATEGLEGLGVSAKFDPGVPLGEDVSLTSVGLSLCLPNSSEPLEIQGSVGVSALDNEVTVTGAFDYTDSFQGQPWSLAVGGTLQISGTQVGMGTLTFTGSGLVTFDISADLDLDGYVDISGEVSGFFETQPPDQFSVLGQVDLKIPDLAIDASGELAVSSVGVAGCINLGSFTVDTLSASGNWDPRTWQITSTNETENLEAGFGYYWGGSVSLWASSCDMSDYEVATPSSARDAAASRSVSVPAHAKLFAIKVSGQSGAPVVSLTGPGGVRIPVPPNGSGERLANGDLLLEDQKAKATSILLVNPPAGRWTITAAPGSPPITAVATAHAETPPTATGITTLLSGGKVGLGVGYAIPPQDKLEVYVAGPHKSIQLVGTAKGSTCSSPSARRIPEKPICWAVKFTPVYGQAGTRTVYGVITRAGIPQQQLKLATFHYAPPAKEAPTLLVTRKRGGLTIDWTAVPNATKYTVGLLLSDRLTVSLPPTKKVTAFVPNIPLRVGATVHVWPTMADGSMGKVGTITIKAGKKSTKPATHKKHKHKH